MELAVREMRLSEVPIRIGYFHSATNEYLQILGVDRVRLPTPDAWMRQYERDAALPLERRASVQLLWLGDGKPVGFSSADNITIGEQATMHLHVIDPGNRRRGIGVQCVRHSVALYFEMLGIKRLFCRPNAFNVAPNRTLQRAGFRYVETIMAAPSPINFHQPVTRWVIERDESGTRGSAW